MLVKPFASDLATNLIITTDRRVYHLAMSSGEGEAMASLARTYPQDALIALHRAAAEAEARAPVAEGLALERLRFDYRIAGDRPGWRPLRATIPVLRSIRTASKRRLRPMCSRRAASSPPA
ncbi:TrbG/VirB9 family P-type conjugative transfer protein [Stakelama tenebrarum]|uniref:TrbG/VirB9 family P-type conjugative transfer protein n=1 Tax=Stakelama tenebrarum TaxID=2711215 RepID=UPI001D18775B|nr:TrbG/VirB9 family P-type conjugative transfer protein [Sphingosinithalassobacter tenebrarum]